MSDAKMPDAQMGYEKGITSVVAGLSGANRVLESAGMMASLMGCCLEALVIDNDMLGMAQRVIRGIEVNDETLSVDTIKQAVLGDGHYLGHADTLRCMESEFFYPTNNDRSTTQVWEAEGSRDQLDRAREIVKGILDNHRPSYIDPAVDSKIRERFPILLNR